MSRHSTDTSTRRVLGSPAGPGLLTLALLAFAQLIISVDYNIVYVALPEIARSTGASQTQLQWIVAAYALGLTPLVLLGAGIFFLLVALSYAEGTAAMIVPGVVIAWFLLAEVRRRVPTPAA